MFEESDKQIIKLAKERMLNDFYSRLNEFPLELRAILIKGFVTGGMSASIFHGESPNDYDVYLKDEKTIADFLDAIKKSENNEHVAEYSSDKYGFEIEEGQKIIKNNAVTLKNKIQVITLSRFEVSRKKFDFVHCMPWLDIQLGTYHISKQQYNAIISKTLIRNPTGSEPLKWRIHKYQQRGWKFNYEK
jgi:hypothetical protein